MPDAIVYVIAGFLALIVAVRYIIDATVKTNLQIHERTQQAAVANETSQTLAELQRALHTTLTDFRTDLREIRAQAATQLTLESVAKYLVEMRQELSNLLEMSTLTRVNTGRIASIERHVYC